jgi:hypothetical protein
MWNWLNCYLSGRHDYGVTCSDGSIFLQCLHCGKRSNGWAVHPDHEPALARSAPARSPVLAAPAATLPFVPRQAAPARRSA